MGSIIRLRTLPGIHSDHRPVPPEYPKSPVRATQLNPRFFFPLLVDWFFFFLRWGYCLYLSFFHFFGYRKKGGPSRPGFVSRHGGAFLALRWFCNITTERFKQRRISSLRYSALFLNQHMIIFLMLNCVWSLDC